MCYHQLLDAIEFMFREAAILGKLNWVKPELCDLPVALRMNVWRLFSVGAVKKQSCMVRLEEQ